MANKTIDGTANIEAVRLKEAAAPATPASGYGKLYEKTDGKVYFKNDGGTEYDLTLSGAGTDATAIHDDTSAEISAITEKTAPIPADLLLIEDSAASNAKKKVRVGNIFGALVGARVYNTANISIPDSTWTAATFDSERFDTDTIHSTVTNTSRLTCNTAGVYMIAGHIDFALNTTGLRGVRILLNGTTVIANIVHDSSAHSAGGYFVMAINTFYKLAATEYVELQVLQVSGGALNLLASANYSPEFGMQRIG